MMSCWQAAASTAGSAICSLNSRGCEPGSMTSPTEQAKIPESSPYREEILSPERVRLWRDQFRRLCLRIDGEREFLDVRATAAFPISGRANLVSFLGERGREVALVRDPQQLDQESRALLEEELGRVYFM